MKKVLAIMVLSIAVLVPTNGCKTVTTTPPIAPGYVSTSDQTMGEVLAAAHAFYNSIQQQSANGQMALSAQEKLAFNTFANTLNAAQVAYLSYHNNPTPANLTTAQNAVNQVQSQQAALPLPSKVNQ